MIKETRHKRRHPLRRLRRGCRRFVYRILVAIYEGELRISLFGIVCTLFLL